MKDKQKVHKCTECEYQSIEPANLRRHFKIRHSGERAHKCELCGQTFTSKHGLVKHQYSVHGKGDLPKLQCDECEFTTIHPKSKCVEKSQIRKA